MPLDCPDELLFRASTLRDRPDELPFRASRLLDRPDELPVGVSKMRDGPDEQLFPRVAHADARDGSHLS